MTRGALLDGEQHLVCPNCSATEIVPAGSAPVGGGATRMHACRGLQGFLAPFVLEGVRCQVRLRVRDDYVNGEYGLRYDADGRPIMSIETIRDDGIDAVLLPGTAVADGRAFSGR